MVIPGEIVYVVGDLVTRHGGDGLPKPRGGSKNLQLRLGSRFGIRSGPAMEPVMLVLILDILVLDHIWFIPGMNAYLGDLVTRTGGYLSNQGMHAKSLQPKLGFRFGIASGPASGLVMFLLKRYVLAMYPVYIDTRIDVYVLGDLVTGQRGIALPYKTKERTQKSTAQGRLQDRDEVRKGLGRMEARPGCG